MYMKIFEIQRGDSTEESHAQIKAVLPVLICSLNPNPDGLGMAHV